MKRKRLRLLLIPVILVLMFNIITSFRQDKAIDAVASLDEEQTQLMKRRAPNLKDGVYRGCGDGFKDKIHVEMIVENGQISSCYVYEHNEHETTSKLAINKIPYEIADKQSVNVDIISGATGTSNGIIEAVKNCIRQAGGNPVDF